MKNLMFLKKKFFNQKNSSLVFSENQPWESILYMMYCEEVKMNGRVCICEDYVRLIVDMIVCWLNSDAVCCLLTGGVGLGKTVMMRVLMRLFEMMRDPITLPPSRYRQVMYIDAARWSFQSANNDELLQEACNCRILLVDDLGGEEDSYYSYGNKHSPIKEVMLARYVTRLPTVITTNLSLEQLAKRYGNRIADRINELYAIIEYPSHESFRRLKVLLSGSASDH